MVESTTVSKKNKETATERARNYIRNKAISFEFYPGESINELELSKKIQISRAPIREALSSLVCEGLITFQPGKGYFCRKLSIKEVSELFEIRSDIEISAIDKIIEIAKDEDIDFLISKYTKFTNNADLFDEVVLVDLDEEFHINLMSLSKNKERIRFLKNINVRIRFVRQINLETPDRKNKFLKEHLQILESIKKREIEKSRELLKKHLGVNSYDLEGVIREGLARIYGSEVGL